MDEFANILQRDYGLKPHGKSAPMTSVKPSGPSPFSSSSPASTPASIQRTSSTPKSKNGSNRNSRSSNPILGESLDEDYFFGSSNGFTASRSTYGSAPSDMPAMYDDVFGGPPKFAAPSYPPMPSSASQQNSSSQSYDDIFRMPVKPSPSTSSSSNKGSSFPVFDAPLYDDDIFGGVPGIRSAGVVYDDVFSGGSTVGTSPSVLEDLLGVSETRDRSSGSQQPVFDSSAPSAGLSAFDDLLPGFGVTEPAKPRPTGAEKSSDNTYTGPEKNSFGMSTSDPFDAIHVDDPFNVPQSASQASVSEFSDSEPIKGPTHSSGSHRRQFSNGDHSESIDGSGNSSPHLFKTQSPSRETRYPSKSRNQTSTSAPSYTTVLEEEAVNTNQSSSNGADEQIRDSSSPKPPERAEAPSFYPPIRRGRQVFDDVEEPVRLPKVVESRQADEYWILVEDVKLVTEPTAAPPPSRRPPLPGLKHVHTSRRAAGLRGESSFKESPSRHESPQSSKISSSRGASEFSNRSTANSASNPYDELEQFVSGVSRARKETKMDMSAANLNEEIMEGSAAASASAMAMKEATERARSKLRERVKEEKESGLRAEETQEDRKEAKEDEEEKVREAEERQRAREREEREREAKALREREEREKRRREREKEREIEREREREREREKDRIAFERAAVERANAEARERLSAEARQRAAAERAAAEAREQTAAAEARDRAAVEKVTAEARERAAAEARERVAAEAREKAAAERAAVDRAAERAAVDRAAAEARERAAAEARERAAAERAASETRTRAERAFVERVNAEARERAAGKAATEARERAAAERVAAEARERAAAERAAAAREHQRRSENDLEAFFASSSRPASAPRQRSPAPGTSSDGRQSNKGFSTEGSQRTSTAAPSARKVTPTSSTDDWTSLFGPAVPAAGEFQEFEGESAERRRARLDRHQRTAERAAKALDEKNQRDLQSQREQAERHRAGEMLDAEIKRWAAGKEGNLRALLSTLQYVLWPECGWQTVSLVDLITAVAVKKVYRKATLCVHPDKVQQKGATIQQKYIAEKVFDLLKEAWNKFNSEELF